MIGFLKTDKDIQKLCSHIKNAGCKLRLYNKELIYKNSAMATFDITKSNHPIISAGILGHSKEDIIEVLAHEFGHFLQWKDGSMQKVEPDKNTGPWQVYENIVSGKPKFKTFYTEEQIEFARDSVLLFEYDAYVRGIQVLNELGIDRVELGQIYNVAHSYISAIKVEFLKKKQAIPFKILNIRYTAMTRKEVLAPLTQKEKVKLTGALLAR